MVYVLSDVKTQRVVALGRQGWPRRPIEDATVVHTETAIASPNAAKAPVRPPWGWRRRPPGTDTSLLALGIGYAAFKQGHKMLFREACVLPRLLVEARLDGTRKLGLIRPGGQVDYAAALSMTSPQDNGRFLTSGNFT